jgi:hypothetical protein
MDVMASFVVENSMPEPNSGCWLWLGHVNRQGYGRFVLGSRAWHSAYRTSYEAFKGEIPTGFIIDHLCRVPGCVNPDHLEVVTPRTNALRGISFSAINAAKTHCAKGHPFSGDNLHIGPTGRRFCRACWRTNTAAYKARRLAE